MRLRLLCLGLLAASACASPSSVAPSASTWRFSGTVSAVDAGRITGPIAGAALTVVDGVNLHATVTSDAQGRYVFPRLEKGRFTLAVAASGYQSASPVVDLYRDTEVNFGLAPR